MSTIQGSLNGINPTIYAEDTNGIVTLVLFRDCGTDPHFLNECTTLNLISDGSATNEKPDTPVGVPEFGVPAIQIAAVGVVALVLLRLVAGLGRPSQKAPPLV
jgi:hypothetical protein